MTGPVCYSREELAWAAGLFDGEGYIGCWFRKAPRGTEAPILNLNVTQHHDPAVLLRFQAAVGGLGRVHARRDSETAIEYTWKTSSFEVVQATVALLWRWLSPPKRAQAARAINGYHGRRAYLGTRAWRRREYDRG